MRFATRYILTAAALLAAGTMLAGCGNQQNTFAAIGGATCGVLASSFKGKTPTRLLRGVLGGGTCAAIGGAFGRALDERDRAEMQLATQQVLQQRLPPQYYATYAVGANYTPPAVFPMRTIRRPQAMSPSVQEVVATAPAPASAPAPSGRLPGLPKAAKAQWVSDHSGATGSAAVVAVEPATSNRGECRTVEESARLPGAAPITAEKRYCESQAGANDWKEL